jgi:sigma-E factor negative regulatory protein RseC
VIEETAVILECQGEFAQAQTERSSACGGCSSRSACETGSLKESSAKESDVVLQVLNPIAAQPGERVVIGFEDEALTKASMAFYTMPLVAFILCALLGQWLAMSLQLSAEPIAALGGIVGLVLGLLGLRHFSSKVSRDEHYQATVLRRVRAARVDLECSIDPGST